ncbi:helix-turn-helix transcriptional regulator [Streptomyces sp. WELS2]|uniref:helix-turn-helix domain-containing protein n=1 Tax=Streptomyces sp. WELS2 TaxID=2749435 RepID=UPI0015F00CCC|nr:helix-turn-helix transcriptional regulator [Streptomyces sp. WELS2]
MGEGVDEAGWDVEPGDEIEPVVQAVGRLLKVCRESAGVTVPELAEALGYGEDMIRKIERGARIPRPEFLDSADTFLKAQGHLRAFREDMRKARYPKKVRALAELEERAVEMLLYSNHNIHGLLQTEEYARALLRTWRPAYSPDQLERMVGARMARKSVFDRSPAPELSFVQEEVTLRRPVGDRMVLRRQLEHMLEVAQLPFVELQVMPTSRANHPGTAGLIEVLKFVDGTGVGRTDGDFSGRPVSNPRQLRVLDLRYGIIRAQALPPEESLDIIEKALGEL